MPSMNRALVPVLSLVAALALGGCYLARYDPVELLAERAPVDAEVCGEVGSGGIEPAPARACVLAALSDGRPFRVLLDADLADGRDAVGWATAAAADPAAPITFLRLDYEAVYGMFPGTDREDVAWTGCASLESHGATCPSLAEDLCLGCVGPTDRTDTPSRAP